MTPKEAREELEKRPPHHRTRRWLRSELEYEKHKGVHTYHQCYCIVNWCRANYCVQCLEEMLKATYRRKGK